MTRNPDGSVPEFPTVGLNVNGDRDGRGRRHPSRIEGETIRDVHHRGRSGCGGEGSEADRGRRTELGGQRRALTPSERGWIDGDRCVTITEPAEEDGEPVGGVSELSGHRDHIPDPRT